MTNSEKASAKDTLLAWVRSKNPQTMEPKELCRYAWSNLDGAAGGGFIQSAEHWDAIQSHPKIDEVTILGSDMGLQELLIAFKSIHGKQTYFGVHTNHPFGCEQFHDGKLVFHVQSNFSPYSHNLPFDLTKNLHSQSDEFYEALLPLIR